MFLSFRHVRACSCAGGSPGTSAPSQMPGRHVVGCCCQGHGSIPAILVAATATTQAGGQWAFGKESQDINPPGCKVLQFGAWLHGFMHGGAMKHHEVRVCGTQPYVVIWCHLETGHPCRLVLEDPSLLSLRLQLAISKPRASQLFAGRLHQVRRGWQGIADDRQNSQRVWGHQGGSLRHWPAASQLPWRAHRQFW